MSDNKSCSDIIEYLKEISDPERAIQMERYFKTGKGEYGEGDIFMGISMPVLRKTIKKFKLPLQETEKLLQSKYHEARMAALLLLIKEFNSAEESGKEEIVQFYLENRSYVNNWDLVDSSAHHILGPWLSDRDRSQLFELAKSDSIWDRRIAVLTTSHFIDNMDFHTTLELAPLLLKDKEDLIHKALGWMLREIGKRDKQTETEFLVKHYHEMPRTMLRYAIEKYTPNERQAFLKGTL